MGASQEPRRIDGYGRNDDCSTRCGAKKGYDFSILEALFPARHTLAQNSIHYPPDGGALLNRPFGPSSLF